MEFIRGLVIRAIRQSRVPSEILACFPAACRRGSAVATLPADALIVFYTDGITEHRRDRLIRERELIAVARPVHARPGLNAARAIAGRVFRGGRGTDDAAAIAVRTAPAPAHRGTRPAPTHRSRA